MPQNNATKMLICAYKDKDFQEQLKESFTLPVNPESFTQNYKVEYNQEQAPGTQSTEPEFKFTAPEELDFEFMFDGTGAIEGYHNTGDKSVHDQIAEFKKVVYDMNGAIHKPNFLKLYWGKLVFQGILTSLGINYTLFNSKGEPLRAKIKVSFLGSISPEERVARENKKSPDITHTRLIKEGDRLDLITHKIYNDSKYVLQIAKANGLTSFRNPEVGKEYVFPPFDKTES